MKIRIWHTENISITKPITINVNNNCNSNLPKTSFFIHLKLITPDIKHANHAIQPALYYSARCGRIYNPTQSTTKIVMNENKEMAYLK